MKCSLTLLSLLTNKHSFHSDNLTVNFIVLFLAFVAALYVDKGLKHVEVLCRVCLFPRLEVRVSCIHIQFLSYFIGYLAPQALVA